MTPADTYQIGSDYIVVGRPITQAEDLLQLIMLSRMNGTKTEMKEMIIKTKRGRAAMTLAKDIIYTS